MEEHFISSGSNVLDNLCEGIEKDVITTIYGPAGSGKTNFCILTAVETVRNDKKVIYIDTDGSFSVERLRQISAAIGKKTEEIMQHMVFYKPVNFQEQKLVFDKLRTIISDKVGLIVVDSIAMLYRLEIGKNSEEVYNINKELGKQLSLLSEIARKKNIPILITNQVYSSFEEKEKVNMVGGDILRYSSKCLIELKSFKNSRKAMLIRHRSFPRDKEIIFKITESGAETIEDIAEKQSQENGHHDQKREENKDNEFSSRYKESF
ncbi:MAG: DNA repair and recombination protein RadB [Nanoarchaeota archaeon]